MSNKLNSHCAQCRRAGIKLMLKGEKCAGPKCPLTKRAYPPGQHGPNARHARLSGYGQQLREKQKAKQTYGIMEKQFARYVTKAERLAGDSGENLVTLLESRLDNVVYRMGLRSSRLSARQLISHGHVTVNGKKVDIPSYSVKTGDVVGVKESSAKGKMLQNAAEVLAKVESPAWLSVDAKARTAKVLNKPTLENPSFDIRVIIEFYSR